MKLYALENSALARLRADRRDLFSASRAMTAAERRAARDDLMESAVVYRTPSADKPLQLDVREGVAHIPIIGQLPPSADPCGAFSMQAETEYGFIEAALHEAASRDDVQAVALDIDSPGGYVAGVDYVAQLIATMPKPVTAYVGDMAASAAYWLASQADSIVATSPASRVGSIGVAIEEYDDREALARDGIAHRVYTSTDAPDKRPDTATDEGRSKVVKSLDDIHAIFVRRVAEGRKVSAEKVNKDFGRGGVLTAEAAMAAGMIDAVQGAHLTRPVFDAGVASSAAAATAAASHIEETRMDLNTLKAEHPDLYTQAEDAGAKKERARIEQLAAFRGVNPDGDRAVEEAVASGKTAIEATPFIMAAIEKGRSRAADGDNPPQLGTATPKSGAGVGPALEVDGLSAVDIANLKAAGMTDDEIRAFAPGRKE